MRRSATTVVLTTAMWLITATAFSNQPRWECWGPDLPDPCRNPLNAIDILPGSNGGQVWATGNGGTILNGRGSVWSKSETPEAVRLVDIAMASDSVGWAVGDEGSLLRWRGAGWTQFDGVTGVDTQVRAVARIPDTDRPEFWMASDWMGFGTFYHFTGSFWNDTGQTYYGSLEDMEIVSSDDGWVICYSVGDTVFYRWNGATWDIVHRSENWYRGLGFSSPDNGWAVGQDGWIAHWNGTDWTETATQNPDHQNQYLLNVATSGPSDAWSVGTCGLLVHWDGAAWSDVHHPSGCIDLNDVAVHGPDAGWIVGDSGLILRFDGDDWKALNAPPISSIRRITQTPGTANDLWAVGSGDTLLHFNGRQWTPVSGPANYYSSIEMLAEDDGWANGGRAFHHWDGIRWTQHQSGDSANDMVFTGPTNGWAVGWDTVQYWNGSNWEPVDAPEDISYLAISAVSPDNVWALGNNDDTMAHFDGTRWTAVQVPDIGGFGGVCMLDDGRGYVAGGDYSGGAALQYVNGNWLPLSVPSSAGNLNAVDVKSLGNGLVGWMVGREGTTIRMSGGLWTEEPTPTQSDLLDVVTISSTEAWAVGRDGVILHWGESLPDPGFGEAVIQASARLSGQAGTDWRTDFTIANLGEDRASVSIQAWLRDQPNPDPLTRTITLRPMASFQSGDVLGSLFGLPDSSAASLVFESDQTVAAMSRTFNATAGGTYGQSIPASPMGGVFSVGQTAVLIGLEETARARSNLGIVNVSDHQIEVEATFFDTGGSTLGSMTYAVPSRGSIQRTRALKDVTPGTVDAAWVRLRSASGSFMAFVSTVDATTGDPVFRPALRASDTALHGVVQGMATVSGASGTNWKSSLIMVNTSDRTRNVFFSRLLRGQANPSPREESVTLAPYEIRVIDDALGELYGMISGAATLKIHTTGAVVITGRTFNQTNGGTYGQTIPVQPESDAVMLGNRAFFVGVTQNNAFRSNLGLTNSRTTAAWIALDLFNADGARVGTRQTLQLTPGEAIQIDRVAEMFGVSRIDSATLVIEPATGSSIDAFLSIIDSRTGDPVFQVPTVN